MYRYQFNLLRSISVTAKLFLYIKLILSLLDYYRVFDPHNKKYIENLWSVQKLLTELSVATSKWVILPHLRSFPFFVIWWCFKLPQVQVVVSYNSHFDMISFKSSFITCSSDKYNLLIPFVHTLNDQISFW